MLRRDTHPFSTVLHDNLVSQFFILLEPSIPVSVHDLPEYEKDRVTYTETQSMMLGGSNLTRPMRF